MLKKVLEENFENAQALPEDLQAAVDYHTHLCGGLLIGYRAVKYAVDLLGESKDMVVMAEKPTCGDDAIRVLLNCTEEKGNLYHQNGEKLSWSFYNKEQEEGITLAVNSNLNLKSLKGGQGFQELLNLPANILFTISSFEI